MMDSDQVHEAVRRIDTADLLGHLDGVLNVCPTCVILDMWVAPDDVTWACMTCGYVGTRYRLERMVLEDADLLAALIDMEPQP